MSPAGGWMVPALAARFAAPPPAPRAAEARCAPIPDAQFQDLQDRVMPLIDPGLPHDHGPRGAGWVDVLMGLHSTRHPDALALAHEWSAGDPRYKPVEVDAKWRSFKDKPGGITVGTLYHAAGVTPWRPGVLDEFSAVEIPKVEKPESKEPALLFTLDSACAKRFTRTPPPPLDYVIKPLMVAGRTGVTGGPGGASKSTLMLQAGVCIANGLDFLGHPTSQGGVLIFGAEDGEDDMHRRLWSIAARHGCRLDNLYIVPRVGLANLLTDGRSGELKFTAMVDAIIRAASQIPDLKLVVFDPASRFRGGDENSAPDATRLVEAGEHIAKLLHAAVWFVHHANKSGAESRDAGQSALRGSSALVDGVRGAWRLRPMTADEARKLGWDRSQADSYVELSAPKSNYAKRAAPMWLERTADGILVPVDLATVQSTAGDSGAYADVLSRVAAHVAAGACASRRQLEREHGGTSDIFGVSAARLRALLVRAIESGDLIEVPQMVDGHQKLVLALPCAGGS